MRVLIIGSDTPVGVALCGYLDQRGREYVALNKAECRWKSERQAKKSLRRSDCKFVVDTRLQAAADGGIRIHDIDVDRSLWLARSSQALKLPFMQLSGARVFSGETDKVYSEEDYPDGVSSIAQLMIGAESALRDNCEKHVILRTGPVFSASGTSVVMHMLAQLHAGGTLTLSRQHMGCPLPAEDAARVVSGMLDQFECGLQAWGIYHYCSSDITNCYEFAEVLLAAASQFEEFPQDTAQLILDEDSGEGDGSSDSNNIRSRNLSCMKIKNTFAIKQQPWRTNVAGQVKQYYASQINKETNSV